MPGSDATEDLMEKVRHLPRTSGVYIFKDIFGRVIYIGKAVNLRRRVSSYFMPSGKDKAYNPKIASLKKSVADMEFVQTRGDAEAVILESRLIKRWKPRYNTLEKDNKNFLLLRVETFLPLPRFTFARNRKDDNSAYFGPYLGTAAIRSTLVELKKKFGIILGDARPVDNGDGTWKLYDDARADISRFPNVVTAEEYSKRVLAAMDFLKDRDSKNIEESEAEMLKASKSLDFERAAKMRDLISAIVETRRMYRGESVDISRPRPEIAMRAADSLKKALGLKEEPVSIECFDISHISGSFCVASMVRFEHGEPARNKYRRFKIKSFVGNDDFRAMEEVVGRRYSRMVSEGSPLPDIILIDGGKGQVFSAMKAFDAARIPQPFIIGLAKKEETVVMADFSEKKLSRRHEGLKLLQRVRDEAHRFANSFSAELRLKKIRESILDDMPNLGPKRKAALLSHFGSIGAVKNADVSELQKVEGIGFETALALREFLDATLAKGECDE